MKFLTLSNSTIPAVVDDDIFYKIKDRSWRVIKVSNGAEYVGWKTSVKGKFKTVYLHRLVMGYPKGQVDHKHRNIFDNRRESLRIATHSQNQMNSRKRKTCTTSKYKNVYWNRKLKKWKAQIRVDGKDYFFGYYDKELHAAYAVELNRPILHREYSNSNFSDELIALSFYAR